MTESKQVIENAVFHEKFDLGTFTAGLKKQLQTDYKRLWEYCRRRLQQNNAMIIVMQKNPPANTSQEELNAHLLRLEGETQAFREMQNQLENRDIW